MFIFAMLMTRRAFSTTIFVITTMIFSTMKKQFSVISAISFSVLYLTGSDKIRNEKLIAEITLILDDILNGKMDLSQHLTLMVNDFGHLAGGINFPHKLARIKGTQVSAILCTESLLPLQTEHYNPMLTDEILDSCNVITEK